MAVVSIIVFTNERKASCRKLPSVFLGTKGARFQSGHCIVPNQWFCWRRKEQAATRREDVGDPLDQPPLILGRKQEDQTPCQDTIEGSIKES